jgi:hypothetical protein
MTDPSSDERDPVEVLAEEFLQRCRPRLAAAPHQHRAGL